MPQNTFDNNKSALVQVMTLPLPPGNKLFPEPVLTQSYVIIWHH